MGFSTASLGLQKIMEKYLLTFELNGDEKEKVLAMHGSPEGVEHFASTISNLVKNTKEGHFNHEHLMSD